VLARLNKGLELNPRPRDVLTSASYAVLARDLCPGTSYLVLASASQC